MALTSPYFLKGSRFDFGWNKAPHGPWVLQEAGHVPEGRFQMLRAL